MPLGQGQGLGQLEGIVQANAPGLLLGTTMAPAQHWQQFALLIAANSPRARRNWPGLELVWPQALEKEKLHSVGLQLGLEDLAKLDLSDLAGFPLGLPELASSHCQLSCWN